MKQDAFCRRPVVGSCDYARGRIRPRARSSDMLPMLAIVTARSVLGSHSEPALADPCQGQRALEAVWTALTASSRRRPDSPAVRTGPAVLDQARDTKAAATSAPGSLQPRTITRGPSDARFAREEREHRSLPRSRRRWAGRPGDASLCCAAGARHGSPASSPAIGGAQRRPELTRRTSNLLATDSRYARCRTGRRGLGYRFRSGTERQTKDPTPVSRPPTVVHSSRLVMRSPGARNHAGSRSVPEQSADHARLSSLCNRDEYLPGRSVLDGALYAAAVSSRAKRWSGSPARSPTWGAPSSIASL